MSYRELAEVRPSHVVDGIAIGESVVRRMAMQRKAGIPLLIVGPQELAELYRSISVAVQGQVDGNETFAASITDPRDRQAVNAGANLGAMELAVPVHQGVTR